MALKYRVDSLDELPEADRAHYKPAEEGTGFELDAPGVVPKDKLENFRSTNKTLSTQLEEYKKKYADIDADEYRELKKKLEAAEGKEGKKVQETKEELERRYASTAAKHAKEMQEKDKEIAAAHATIANQLIDKEVSLLATEYGPQPKAMEYIIDAARKIFKLENGVVVAYRNADEKWFSEATGEILKVGEWVKMMVKESPYLFKPSVGTGSTGGSATKPATGGVPNHNPWKDPQNRTEQAVIVKADIERARRLCKEAGQRVRF